jgi:adenylosuccinate lyase
MGAHVGTRLTDAQQYAHLWGTAELAGVFEERARLQSWLDILTSLAVAQARLGIIPTAAATQIAAHADASELDLDFVAAETRRTSHSMLGLINGLQRLLPEDAREHVYVGATVQDVTDTWFALVMRRVGAVLWRDLRAIEDRLLDLAAEHRDTLMAGRTHGQPGSPITFGFKVASWADEVGRHRRRLSEGRPRWLVGQLGGAVGTLGFFAPLGAELRAEFCAELGLADPGVSWLSSRDRIAEFGSVLAMVCGTLARIGNEVYELQRPEIGELREPTTADTVGSITMPHKRNPEGSEHLDTLARLVRAQAQVLTEGMVVGHERDGRGWKAEWVALPEVCLLTGGALQTALHLLSGLVVDPAAMRSNLERHGDQLASEQMLAGLTRRLGKHAAQRLMHDVLAPGYREVHSVLDALVAEGVATEQDRAAWTTWGVGDAGRMVDEVVARARLARSTESEAGSGAWT